MWVIWVVWVICGFLKSIDVLWLWDDFRSFPGNLVEVTLHSAPSDGAADWQNRKTNEIWELLALSRAFPSGGQPRSDFQPWLKMSSELWGDSKFKSYAVMLFWSPQIDSPRVSSAFPPPLAAWTAWTAILKPSQGLGSPSSLNASPRGFTEQLFNSLGWRRDGIKLDYPPTSSLRAVRKT